MAKSFQQNKKTDLAKTLKKETQAETITDIIDKQIVLQTLHISDRTLQNWRSTGRLPFYKVGGKIFYKRSEIEQMVEASRTLLKPPDH